MVRAHTVRVGGRTNSLRKKIVTGPNAHTLRQATSVCTFRYAGFTASGGTACRRQDRPMAYKPGVICEVVFQLPDGDQGGVGSALVISINKPETELVSDRWGESGDDVGVLAGSGALGDVALVTTCRTRGLMPPGG